MTERAWGSGMNDRPRRRQVCIDRVVLFANRAAKLTESYLRFLESVIRKEWPAPGVPFRMSVRGKQPKEKRGGR